MNFINKQNRAVELFKLFDDSLEAFLEITTIAGTCQKGAHIKGKDRGIGQNFGDITIDNPTRQTFGDGGFANPGITDIKRIVFGAAAQDLNGALDLALATDQRIDLALLRLDIEVHAIGLEGLTFTGCCPFLSIGSCPGRNFFLGAARNAALVQLRRLGNTMRNVIDRIQTGHVLQLQIINRVRFTFRKQRDQHIRPGDFFTSGGLNMNGCALYHALEPGRWLGIDQTRTDQPGKFAIGEFQQIRTQTVNIDPAGLQHRQRILIFGQ